jgi:hypothetical protein
VTGAPRGRGGRLAVIAIILFALAFAVGGFLAVKAITAGRGPDAQKEAPRRD